MSLRDDARAHEHQREELELAAREAEVEELGVTWRDEVAPFVEELGVNPAGPREIPELTRRARTSGVSAISCVVGGTVLMAWYTMSRTADIASIAIFSGVLLTIAFALKAILARCRKSWRIRTLWLIELAAWIGAFLCAGLFGLARNPGASAMLLLTLEGWIFTALEGCLVLVGAASWTAWADHALPADLAQTHEQAVRQIRLLLSRRDVARKMATVTSVVGKATAILLSVTTW